MALSNTLERGVKDQKDLEALRAQFSDCDFYRQRAVAVIKQRLESRIKEKMSDDYSSPAWSEKQADRNGCIRELNFVLREIFGIKNGVFDYGSE